MVHRLRCFIRGYVRVRLIGNEIYRLFNMCKSNALVLRKITQEENQIYCNILVADLFRMLPLLRKTHTRIKVVRRVGLPFWMQKMKKRLCFCLCLLGCLFTLNAVEKNVWAIEYIGNSRITSNELHDFAQSQNIYYGIKKSSLDIPMIERNLREKFPIVTWVSVYLEGTKLCFEIKENEVTEYEHDNMETGSDLVATEAGMVTSIITRNGTPKIKTGEWVEKGQVLVEGLVPIYDEAGIVIDYQIYEADADIYINTILPYVDSVQKRYSIMEYTGRVQNSFFLETGDRRYEFPGFLKNFERYEKVSQKKQISILDDMYLPLFYGTVMYKEYQLCYLEHTQKEQETILQYNFRHFMETLEGKGVQIIEKNVKISNDTDSMYMKGEILVNKKTGTRRSIDSSDWEWMEEKDTLEGVD